MKFNFSSKPFATHGGTHVPDSKSTAQMQSVSMPIPAQVILPMLQHVGAPCTPLVKVGETVFVGQKIGESDALISAPIHASISGRVSAVKKVMLPNGVSADAVVIDSDGKMEVSPDIKPPAVKTVQEFIHAIRESGLVGLGGAGFPTHVKLTVPQDKHIDTLIINIAECEPYITADHREVLENTEALLSGICTVRDFLNIEQVIIAVEKNKPDAIEILQKNIQQPENSSISILPLLSRYPQGAEKVLVKTCTNRSIPMGMLPADAGCLVLNVGTAAFIADYLKTGMPLIKKRVTIDGSAVKNPQNVIAPIGTRISEIIAFCGGYQSPLKKLLMGGPMMGLSVADDSLPIIKQNNAILAFNEHESHLQETTACIRCGRCVEGCPMNLMPVKLEQFAGSKDIENLKEYDAMCCIECGTCSFNCPAGRPLVQAIRLGKGMIKAGGNK